MDPLKYAFDVSSGWFLGFIVRHRGIEIDPKKITAIIEMPKPKISLNSRDYKGDSFTFDSSFPIFQDNANPFLV